MLKACAGRKTIYPVSSNRGLTREGISTSRRSLSSKHPRLRLPRSSRSIFTEADWRKRIEYSAKAGKWPRSNGDQHPASPAACPSNVVGSTPRPMARHQTRHDLHRRTLRTSRNLKPRRPPGGAHFLETTYGPSLSRQSGCTHAPRSPLRRKGPRRNACQSPPMKDRKRCRIHGGLSPGAPRGQRNGNYKDGYWIREAVEERKSSDPWSRAPWWKSYEQI